MDCKGDLVILALDWHIAMFIEDLFRAWQDILFHLSFKLPAIFVSDHNKRVQGAGHIGVEF